MENPSLTLHASKERTPGCPGSTRAPSPASPWGCTDFKLLQAGKAGDVRGYCMWGRSSSCQWRRFVPGPQNCFFLARCLHVCWCLRVSLGTHSLEVLHRSSCHGWGLWNSLGRSSRKSCCLPILLLKCAQVDSGARCWVVFRPLLRINSGFIEEGNTRKSDDPYWRALLQHYRKPS